MTGTVIAVLVLCVLIVLVIVGVPLWLTFRRKHTKPNYRDAQGHAEVREAGTDAVLSSPDYVPAERVNPLDGLTVPQEPEQDPPMGGLSGQARRRPVPGDRPDAGNSPAAGDGPAAGD